MGWFLGAVTEKNRVKVKAKANHLHREEGANQPVGLFTHHLKFALQDGVSHLSAECLGISTLSVSAPGWVPSKSPLLLSPSLPENAISLLLACCSGLPSPFFLPPPSESNSISQIQWSSSRLAKRPKPQHPPLEGGQGTRLRSAQAAPRGPWGRGAGRQRENFGLFSFVVLFPWLQNFPMLWGTEPFLVHLEDRQALLKHSNCGDV